MRVADLILAVDEVLSTVQLLDADQELGATTLTAALSLSMESPGMAVPHGVYIVEALRLTAPERQRTTRMRQTSLAVVLISRVRPAIGQPIADVRAAWELAERTAETLERDIGGATLRVDAVSYRGMSADGAMVSHLIEVTAIHEGG
jgi:hypothetical protein